MPARSPELPTIALDYRPALHNREGIGRVARELVRALASDANSPPLVLFGAALRRPRVERFELGLCAKQRLIAARCPARLTAPLLRLLGGVDGLYGAGLVHHTQLRELPSKRAPSTGMVFDLLYRGGGSGWLDPRVAAGMETRLLALLPHWRRVQVTSHFVRDQLIKDCGVADDAIDVVPLGGDHVLRHPRSERSDARLPSEPYFVTVSRVDPRKGHLVMLRAFERLVADGFDGRWIVVGPAGYRADEIAHALAASQVAHQIEWRRAVPDDELAALVQHCTAFVFPSLAEGFGLPPIEALWAGAPVVSSRATCLAEVVGDGADTFDPTDASGGDELLAALMRVASDSDHRAALVARGARWRERYTWAACADATLASWRRTLGESGTRVGN